MSFNILFVTATSVEADALRKITTLSDSVNKLSAGNCFFDLLITGIGPVATTWAVTKWLATNKCPDLVVNAGIAGSFRDEIMIGEVVIPVSDCFADIGIEVGTGFKTLAEAGLENPDRFPFSAGKLISSNKFVDRISKRIRTVNAISVSTSTGTLETRQKLFAKFDPDIETMEGASFFYTCLKANVPFIAVRSISNIVEERDISRWNINLALDNLALELQNIFYNLF